MTQPGTMNGQEKIEATMPLRQALAILFILLGFIGVTIAAWVLWTWAAVVLLDGALLLVLGVLLGFVNTSE